MFIYALRGIWSKMAFHSCGQYLSVKPPKQVSRGKKRHAHLGMWNNTAVNLRQICYICLSLFYCCFHARALTSALSILSVPCYNTHLFVGCGTLKNTVKLLKKKKWKKTGEVWAGNAGMKEKQPVKRQTTQWESKWKKQREAWHESLVIFTGRTPWPLMLQFTTVTE